MAMTKEQLVRLFKVTSLLVFSQDEIFVETFSPMLVETSIYIDAGGKTNLAQAEKMINWISDKLIEVMDIVEVENDNIIQFNPNLN